MKTLWLLLCVLVGCAATSPESEEPQTKTRGLTLTAKPALAGPQFGYRHIAGATFVTQGGKPQRFMGSELMNFSKRNALTATPKVMRAYADFELPTDAKLREVNVYYYDNDPNADLSCVLRVFDRELMDAYHGQLGGGTNGAKGGYGEIALRWNPELDVGNPERFAYAIEVSLPQRFYDTNRLTYLDPTHELPRVLNYDHGFHYRKNLADGRDGTYEVRLAAVRVKYELP